MSSHEGTERKESRRSSCTWAIIVVAVEKVLLGLDVAVERWKC